MADDLIKNNNHESEDFDMTKIRDYNMNGTIILGVDAGYGNYKTARCCFPTSVSRSDQPPIFTRNFLEYDGGYYTIGEGHKDFVAEKSMDDDNYILTLAAICEGAESEGTVIGEDTPCSGASFEMGAGAEGFLP